MAGMKTSIRHGLLAHHASQYRHIELRYFDYVGGLAVPETVILYAEGLVVPETVILYANEL